MSKRAKKTDEIGGCLKLVIDIELIVLAMLSFLNLKMTGNVYYESKDRLYRREVTFHDGVKGPLGSITPVLETLSSNKN